MDNMKLPGYALNSRNLCIGQRVEDELSFSAYPMSLYVEVSDGLVSNGGRVWGRAWGREAKSQSKFSWTSQIM